VRFMVESPAQSGRLRTLIHPGPVSGVHVTSPSLRSLEPYLKLREAFNAPLWLGEFGEDRREWIAKVVELCEQNKIGWAIWAWKRVYLGRDRPAIQTIDTPASWERLANHLVGDPFTRRPTPDEAERGMTEMLEALSTARTREDPALLTIFRHPPR
jgi:endoglucanase